VTMMRGRAASLRPLTRFSTPKKSFHMDRAKEALKEPSARHCTPPGLLTDEFSGVPVPPKDPSDRSIVSVQIRSDSNAVVETQLKGQSPPTYQVFSLRKVDEQWRIARIELFSTPANQRVDGDPDLDELAKRQPALDAAQDFPEGLERLFEGPARLKSRDGMCETEIVQAGKFNVWSGFIAGGDPSDWRWGAAVFEVKLAPGAYPVELVVEKELGVIGAARIIFNRRTKPATRVYARRRDNQTIPKAENYYENSYVIAIDGGVLGLADARDVSALTVRQREEFYNRMVEQTERDRAKGHWFVKLSGDRMALTIHTGHGDGGYPAYWLLDKEGRPVSLLFDFVDLGEPIYETLQVTLNNQLLDGELSAPELAARHVSVAFTKENGLRILDITTEHAVSAALFDRTGKVIANSESAGSRQFGKTKGYYLPKTLPERFSGRLEIQLYRGHRYHFVKGKYESAGLTTPDETGRQTPPNT
jgi:hypothetical protein